jgi:hypothetical protein
VEADTLPHLKRSGKIRARTRTMRAGRCVRRRSCGRFVPVRRGPGVRPEVVDALWCAGRKGCRPRVSGEQTGATPAMRLSPHEKVALSFWLFRGILYVFFTPIKVPA